MAIPLKEERQQRILEIARDSRQVTVADLSNRFDVSEVTIRRDLRDLAEQGVLRRAHGGAVVAVPATSVPTSTRTPKSCQAVFPQMSATTPPSSHTGLSPLCAATSASKRSKRAPPGMARRADACRSRMLNCSKARASYEGVGERFSSSARAMSN